MGIVAADARHGWVSRGWAWAIAVLVAASVLGLSARSAEADVTYPPRPLDRAFIADEAKLITDADAAKIVAICNKALTDKRVPIVVCTITSLADHGARGWTIERYAMNLFDEWGIGSKEYNYGILVLVSKGDRKARIELGAGWTRERDEACARIMSTDMVPRFKKEDYSGGILAGVQQLDAIARVASKPAPPAPQGTAGSQSAPATSAPSAPAPSAAENGATTSNAQPYAYAHSSGSSRHGVGSSLSLGCLVIPLIAVVVILRLVKGLFGWGGGSWGRGIYPGGYYGSGWGSSWGSGGGGWSSGGGGGWSGGGGGFGGGSFGGGSSGGGGASGSW